ncbi:MAG TPA: acyltransferase [Candidatus Binataceae bacterium]|nr:acyltransferase [Candidatus Binataceae bacterium]
MPPGAQTAVSSAEPRIEPVKKAAARFYIPELDSLRFLAFFAVFLFHLPVEPLPFWPRGIERYAVASGGFGAALLFTLSAFLITKLFLREIAATGRIHYGSFQVRRILRLWPLYYSFTIVAFLLSRYSGYYSVDSSYLLLAIVFLGNLRFYQNQVFGPLWAVSVGEHFYLSFPLTVGSGSRHRLATVAGVMVALGVVARIVLIRYGIVDPPLWQNTFVCMDQFAVGVVAAAYAGERISALGILPRLGLLAAGLAGWLIAAGPCDFWSMNPTLLHATLSYPILALANAAILLSAIGAAEAGARFMLHPWLRYLGEISFGLYVYHGVAIVTARIVMFRIVLAWLVKVGAGAWMAWPIYLIYTAIAFGLSTALAAASYHWLELPFLRMKNRFTIVPSRPV